MNLRGFKGVLNIDVAKRTLEIEVVPRDKGVENATTKTNSLSGGERSYSTVALLISLWSCVDNPFYFLDEYDVFTVSDCLHADRHGFFIIHFIWLSVVAG